MKWLRTKYIDTHYPDERAGEGHTRGMRQLMGLRSDGQLFEAHDFADRATPESLRAFLDSYLEVLVDFPGETTDTGKGDPGWIEEPEPIDCLSCGKPMVEGVVEYGFPYGVENPVTLTVSHIGWRCNDCGEILTDYRGEEARTDAVKKHLAEAV